MLPNEATQPVNQECFELVARFVHISDAQVVDEESPGRLTAFASLLGLDWRSSELRHPMEVWRPNEAYSIQLLDGVIRTVNKLHVARHRIDFLIHTGDAVDNAQLNELEWFMTVLDGGMIDPRTGPDDREPASRPDPLLDPHHPFEAQGLYRNGVHGEAPSIPWYGIIGNHDRFAGGTLPIVTDILGRRVSPLPFENRIGLFLPPDLNPTGNVAWAPITPANPGPPAILNLPAFVPANSARRFITDRDFVEAHLSSVSDPPGHGFSEEDPERTWYSVSPVPGVRLIALNSSVPLIEQPRLVFSEGAISLEQRRFLIDELEQAQARGECVIVSTHHPSAVLERLYGTTLTPRSFRELLNSFPCVKLHLVGHFHNNVVIDRGGYVEIITSSPLNPSQQGRVIEIWRAGDDVELRYWLFSHLDEIDLPDKSYSDLFDDPLLPMRRIAAEIAASESVFEKSGATGSLLPVRLLEARKTRADKPPVAPFGTHW